METEYFGGEEGNNLGRDDCIGQGQLQDQAFFQATKSLFFFTCFEKPGSNKSYRKQNYEASFCWGIFSSICDWHLSRLRWPGTPGKEPPRLKGPVAPEVFDQAARSGKVGGWMERCRDFGNQVERLEAAAC